MDPQLIKRIVEAALLAANQPLTAVQLHGLFPLDEPAPDGSIAQALESLQADCAERGVELVEVASGWRYQVKADVHAWVARLWTERQTRYTRATLETLALIAYRQPITRGEIEQVRGVAVNSNIIKALEEREWIRVVGHRDIPGRPELLGTTKGFLDYFNLKRLDELPPLSELKDFGELDPQLQFDGKTGDAMPVGDIAGADGDAPQPEDGGEGDTAPAGDVPSEAHDATDTDEIETTEDDTAAAEDAAQPEQEGDAAETPADDALPQPEPPSQDETDTDALAVEGDSNGVRNE
ncbi:MAG TPA: SMC-Scp complex subunit ScpB [Luteimonas sp.]|nr:SMC-Scp complex subunit ScpB [Luteimonas sp.]